MPVANKLYLKKRAHNCNVNFNNIAALISTANNNLALILVTNITLVPGLPYLKYILRKYSMLSEI